jgi:hypothetical protein
MIASSFIMPQLTINTRPVLVSNIGERRYSVLQSLQISILLVALSRPLLLVDFGSPMADNREADRDRHHQHPD